MESTIKAPPTLQGRLGEFWQRYFQEIPTCSCEECAEVAVEVDPFFPYLDDLNRCLAHQEPVDSTIAMGTMEQLAVGSLS
jgi:hypothetical protein